jgi:hypothetical protein
MTATYIRILIEKCRASAELNEDLILRALGELLEIERQRPILVLFGDEAWQVPRTDGVLRELVRLAATGPHSAIRGYVRSTRGALELVSSHHYEVRYYSEIVRA